MSFESTDDLLEPAEVAEILHKTEAGLAQWRYQGKGPKYIKVGSRVLYRRNDIRGFLDRCTVVTSDSPGGH